MSFERVAPFLIAALTMGPAAAAPLENEPPASMAEQVMQLEASCAASAEARTQRHASEALYERLGGREPIRALIAEVVRLHRENEAIRHLFEGVDTERLVESVAQFLTVGSGGPGEYTGRDMRSAHSHLKLTDADFLAAGGDIQQAMQNLGYQGEEIEEVVCSLVPLRGEVVSASQSE